MGHSTNNIHTSRVNLDQGKVQYSTRNSISYLTPYAGLILTVTTIIVALARFYLLQNAILPRIYCPGTLEKMSSLQRRSFINHHMAASLKVVLIMTAIYPLFAILTGKALPSTPLSPGSKVTAGDMLIISTQIFAAMYIFELFFRDEISPISCAHHVGAITIGQAAVAMSFDAKHERDALWEALLCFLWGTFDIIAELWPHIAMIFYRMHDSNHKFLARLFYATMWLELLGTLIETVVMMVLFSLLWKKWSLSLKIATPLLHMLFSLAQLWGAWIFRGLAKQQQRKSTEEVLSERV